ncbi:MAG: hypothetical protein J0I24_09500 [Thiomonas arsenitoxydans]|uniref:Uncharacterized protein n=1 Tax=Thiomonas arsenitoxydans (strain DSM 22701 / CIP 110005 / 3As) TaxID=426114 RepID=A0A8I1MY90_THIA3|nr:MULTISPECIES: hypothetical protein [Thiomonas]MBN8744529.1 hypothetical protein [Thiomonas arsenitoxydans]ODU96984.1 MAG: hypothetical protein ABT24_06785 [Thiomonas sp. SCN 64-16]
MNNELDELLCQSYPLIFAERHLSQMQTCMCWGIACGDGWFDLIDALCERLQFWTDHNNAPQVVARQVKEKFGTLRFYSREANETQRGMIYMAEAMSARICDQCGRPGRTLVHKHGHMTRCTEHAPDGAITLEAFLAQRKEPGIAP